MEILWPTPNTAFHRGFPLETYIQPAASGKVESGLFGCVRNANQRFHEGVDLKSIRRDKKGRATDPVFAAMAGRVVYVNAKPGNSNYGRYIVVEHERMGGALYTLYAHLKSISSEISVGALVEAGTGMGVIGRSAGSSPIPRSRAHLHFEVGLRLSNGFQSWYNKQDFGNKNRHGLWSGMNLVGLNPLDFFQKVRSNKALTLKGYLRDLPTAFTVRVSTTRVPDFVHRYPTLLTRQLPNEAPVGWDIDFTWFGLPKSWTPLSPGEHKNGQEGDVTLLHYDRGLLKTRSCRKTILITPQGPQLGKSLRSNLKILFSWY